MSREWTTKSFKSGNSVALRVPASVGMAPGEEWKLVEDGDAYRLERSAPQRRTINVDAFWGKSKGIGLLAPEERLFEQRPSIASRPDDERP